MAIRTLLTTLCVCMAAVFLCESSIRSEAPGVPLTGNVPSKEEGRMEGVLVSAKQEGPWLANC